MINHYFDKIFRLRYLFFNYNHKLLIMASAPTSICLLGTSGNGNQFSLSTNTRIAVSNMFSTNNLTSNLQQVVDIVKLATQSGCSMVFLPDSSDFIAKTVRETLLLAQPINGKIVRSYCRLALENNIWISVGGIHEADMDSNSNKLLFKTHLIINNKGVIIALYRKMHLFDQNIAGQEFTERDIFTRGSNIGEPVPTIVGPIGLQNCYDIRFPEPASLLTMMGARILAYPSSHTYEIPAMRWHIMTLSRAIEQQCFVVAATQRTTTREYIDNSAIIDPSGNVIAKCRPNEIIATAYIDLNLVNYVRNIMPRLEHRRWDCYSICTQVKYAKNIKFDPTKTASHYSFLNNSGIFRFGHALVPMSTIFCHSAYALAFTNIRCVVPGHVLVVTKRQVARLKDLGVDEAQDFFQLVGRVERLVAYVQKATAMTITIQDGEDAGQTVKHVHCHIMPRRPNDFEHNDLIYAALDRHDAPGPAGDAGYDRRTMEEMITEARKYIFCADYF